MATTKSYTQCTSYGIRHIQNPVHNINSTHRFHTSRGGSHNHTGLTPTDSMSQHQSTPNTAGWLTDYRGPTHRDRLSKRGGQSPIVARSVVELCVWHPSPPKKVLGVEDDDVFLSRSVARGLSTLNIIDTTKHEARAHAIIVKHGKRNTVGVQSGSTLLAGEDAAQPEIDDPRLRCACPLYT